MIDVCERGQTTKVRSSCGRVRGEAWNRALEVSPVFIQEVLCLGPVVLWCVLAFPWG